MALRTKLYLGFTIMILLTIVTAAISIQAFRRVNSGMDVAGASIDNVAQELIPTSERWMNISNEILNAGMSYYAFAYSFLPADYALGESELDAMDKELASLDDILAKADRGRLPASRAAVPQVRQSAAELRRLGKQLFDADVGMRKNVLQYISVQKEVETLVDDEYNAAADAQKEIVSGKEFSPEFAAQITDRLDFFSYAFDRVAWGNQAFWRARGLRGDEAKSYYEKTRENMTELIQKTDEFNVPANMMEDSDRELFRQLRNNTVAINAASQEIADTFGRIDELTAGIKKLSDAAIALVRSTSRTTAAQVLTAAESIRTENNDINGMVATAEKMQLAVLGAAVLIGFALAFFIVRSIVRPINLVINHLEDDEKVISSAAQDIANASHSLAEGANEQASALEETSSALEQIASMTRMSSDNANRTNDQTRDTIKLVQQGSASMHEMADAMAEINERSEKVSQIIKTIEDIAFQTNLLALNAAVEAARAGEAGKGFAVVADEVRNLSQRSAAAARDTTSLIQGTVESIRAGSAITDGLAESYRKIEEGTSVIGNLIDQIANAAIEQAQGVDQVNNAVAQMDKVTQQNASASEETAAASGSMTDQMNDLRSTVGNLVSLIYGKGGGAARSKAKKPAPGKTPPAGRKLPPKPPKYIAETAPRPRPQLSEPSGSQPNVMRPDAVIPLEGDEDFGEF